MRAAVDIQKLTRFMEEIGKAATGPGRVYLVGGSTALLLGIRNQTIDIDLKLDPEPKGVFEAIAILKESLSLNVELASPDLFLPALPGWEDRSQFIAKYGDVDFYHFDFYSQVLSKILRGHRNDLDDARALMKLGKVIPERLETYLKEIGPQLIRFPAINPSEFESRVADFINENR